MTAVLTRADLFEALTDAFTPEEGSSDVIVYPEPPEGLLGKSVVIAPRDPYQTPSTYGQLETHLSVSVLVPRTAGPAMETIDAMLSVLRAEFDKIGGCKVGDTYVGIVDEVGGVQYLAAMVQISLS